MAEHSRFFNWSVEDDPADLHDYKAADFAEYFSRFLSDGLYTENGKAGLQVLPGTGLEVQVATGYAFIRGYMYHNDAALTKTLDPADTMLDRVDRVVLRFDEVAREILVDIKTGTFSSTPAAPGLEITSTVKELGLAQVYVRKGATSLATKDITDERLTSACGLVSSLITIPAQEMWDVWNQALDGIEAAWAAKQGDIQGEWDTEFTQIKTNWQSWFASVQDTLGSRVFSGPTEPVGIQPGDHWLKEV